MRRRPTCRVWLPEAGGCGKASRRGLWIGEAQGNGCRPPLYRGNATANRPGRSPLLVEARGSMPAAPEGLLRQRAGCPRSQAPSAFGSQVTLSADCGSEAPGPTRRSSFRPTNVPRRRTMGRYPSGTFPAPSPWPAISVLSEPIRATVA